MVYKRGQRMGWKKKMLKLTVFNVKGVQTSALCYSGIHDDGDGDHNKFIPLRSILDIKIIKKSLILYTVERKHKFRECTDTTTTKTPGSMLNEIANALGDKLDIVISMSNNGNESD